MPHVKSQTVLFACGQRPSTRGCSDIRYPMPVEGGDTYVRWWRVWWVHSVGCCVSYHFRVVHFDHAGLWRRSWRRVLTQIYQFERMIIYGYVWRIYSVGCRISYHLRPVLPARSCLRRRSWRRILKSPHAAETVYGLCFFQRLSNWPVR